MTATLAAVEIQHLPIGDLAILLRRTIDRTEELEAAHKKVLEPLMATRRVIEGVLEQHMLDAKATSMRTDSGTLILQHTDQARCGDWNALYAYIRETGRFDLLHKRITNEAVRVIVDDTKALPPGVTLEVTRKLTLRRS
jgi:hypothetical protein